MIDLEAFAATHPAPLRDEASAPFFDAAAEDRFALPRCVACDLWLPPSATVCQRCLHQVDWFPASGRGRVFSWTVIHNAPAAFRSETPYVVAEIELEEGPRLESRMLGVSPGEMRLDLTVKAAFCHPPEGDSYPIFVPVEG